MLLKQLLEEPLGHLCQHLLRAVLEQVNGSGEQCYSSF